MNSPCLVAIHRHRHCVLQKIFCETLGESQWFLPNIPLCRDTSCQAHPFCRGNIVPLYNLSGSNPSRVNSGGISKHLYAVSPGLTQRYAIPVRVNYIFRKGHGKLVQPNTNVPSTTAQKFVHENSMSHNWPPETLMNGKFLSQKPLFDHPSASPPQYFTCRPSQGCHSFVIETQEFLMQFSLQNENFQPTICQSRVQH